ncbi:MAG: hypothetical protein P1R58_04495 [bacterium]|nr:hypothetical protein [bacterium]
MKKIVLAIVLLAILAGVSYVKSIRGQNVKNEAFKQGRKLSASELSQTAAQAESLKIALSNKELELADSITARSLRETARMDSVVQLISEKEKQIDHLQGKLKKSQEKSSAGSQKTDPKEALDKKIIEYYKTRYSRLPADLTEYEKKVSLNEIREETAAKYSITAAKLKEIRSRYGLKY